MNTVKNKGDFFSSKKFMIVLSLLGLYLFSTGTSWAIFSFLKGGPGSDFSSEGLESDRLRIEGLPKTEECPINGMMYTEPERAIWEGRRPIAAMIENHHDSRPPSGISKADVVYEAVAEGGITRFLTIFYCGTAAEEVKIAPVRSVRVYYIDWASEYGEQPIFMHVGGANDYAGFGETVKEARALELLETIGWRYPRGNDFDTTYDSGFPVFWRNYERLEKTVATEHTMMASLDAAYREAEKRDFTNKDENGDEWNENFVKWDFADDSALDSPKADNISFTFWEDSQFDELYTVDWTYDGATNSYLRNNGGEKYLDLETDEQLRAKNVVVVFTKERGPVDRNAHMLYTTIGEGSILVFQNGDVMEGTWEKDSRTDRTTFFNEEGDEISFVRGPIWIEILPKGNDVDY